MAGPLVERSLSPRNLVLDLLSVAKGNALPVRTLVRAGESMGITGNGLRVALSRLRADGKVVQVRRGTYALSATARKRNLQVLAWGEVQASRVPWAGGWIGAAAGAGESDLEALTFLGFAPLTPALFVRPDNLRSGLEGVRRQLLEVGLAEATPTFRLRDLDREAGMRARDLWDARGLAAAHRTTAAALRRSARRVKSEAPEVALREMFLLGGQAIRQIVRDPRLPDELASPAPLADLVQAMRSYDVLGRKLWVQHLGLPARDYLPDAPADWAGLRDSLPTETIKEAS